MFKILLQLTVCVYFDFAFDFIFRRFVKFLKNVLFLFYDEHLESGN